MDWLVFWDVQRYSVHSVFNFTQSTVVNKTQIWLRSWLLCWRRQSDVGSDASSTCLAVLLFCCSAVWLFCCFADVMNRTELCSYTFDICEGVKLVRRPRVCRPTRLIYLYFFFSFRFPIFCVCPFLFVCWFVGWLVVCFVCLQIACRLNPFRWLFRLCVPSFSFFFFHLIFNGGVWLHRQWVEEGAGAGAKQTAARQCHFCCCFSGLIVNWEW